jgi:hypothetical protein
MRNYALVPILSLFLLSACNDVRKASNSTFAASINQYLAIHGKACTPIDQSFPVDVPRAEQTDPYGIGPKLAALEQAGLVRGSDTTAVVHGMLTPLRGSAPPQPVRRYELTGDGQKYFQQITGTLAQTAGFCYGQKSVGSVVKWTEPQTAGPYSQAEVTYTYKLVNVAAWAERPEVQRAFPDIKTTISGALKTNEIAEVQLTNKGWEVSNR